MFNLFEFQPGSRIFTESLWIQDLRLAAEDRILRAAARTRIFCGTEEQQTLSTRAEIPVCTGATGHIHPPSRAHVSTT